MIDRRVFLAGASMSALASCVHGALPSKGGQRTNVVLVHGAWHGGWCWDFVRPQLEQAGLTVSTPTLTGLAERADALTPDTSLATHIDDVVSKIVALENQKVVLVGHSYGGMVITGAADRVPDRISHLVYLDAVVPEDGRSMLSVGPDMSPEALAAASAGLKALSTDGGLTMQVLPPEAFGVPQGHEHYEWVRRHLTPHPLRTWFDPISLTADLSHIPKTFVHCTAPVLDPSSIPLFAARAKEDPQWSYFELETGHDAMVTAPVDVARIVSDTALS